MPSIRHLADPADRPALMTLLRRCADYAHLERGRGYDGADLAEIMAAGLSGGATGPGLRLVLEGDGCLDGVALMEFGFPDPRDAYVTLLMLAPEARGQGHGAGLLARLVAGAHARGCPAIHASVIDRNPRGLAFWTRKGFVVVWTSSPTLIGACCHVYHRLRLSIP